MRPRPPKETIGLQHIMIVEPLELEVLATLSSPEHQAVIVDMILEKKDPAWFIRAHKPDMICLTGYITHVPILKEYCLLAKSIDPGIITVCGGVHIELFPEDLNGEYVDFRVVRNACCSFPRLLKYLSYKGDFPGGVLRKTEVIDHAKLPDFDFYFPIPDRSFTRQYHKKYFYIFHKEVALMKTSFGCPFHCSFCYCRKITGEIYAERPLADVILELQGIPQEEIYIVDDDFLCSASRLKNFLKLLKENNIRKKYLIYGRADFIASHEDLIQEFKEAGLRTVIVGLESFFDEELSQMNKQSNGNTNERALQVLNHHGVDCYAAVILSPGWGKEEFAYIRKQLLNLKVRFVNLQPLTPLKGTDMVAMEDKLIVSRDDFEKWDLAHVILQPEKLSLDAYYIEIIKLYNAILFRPSHLWQHLKYPLSMQFKLMKGLYKVYRQYKKFARPD
ncbi:MAG: radical SAM protein [Bacteroidota bacterium]